MSLDAIQRAQTRYGERLVDLIGNATGPVLDAGVDGRVGATVVAARLCAHGAYAQSRANPPHADNVPVRAAH